MKSVRKYDTAEHRKARRHWRGEVDAGRAWCAELECLMTTRFIPPGSSFDVAHDESGLFIIGASHPACNRSEGASRGNRQRRQKASDRWWVL